MKAAVLTNPKYIEVQKVAPPQIKENQVLIKVDGCGICASSLPLWEGREWFQYPQEPGTPGHEGWGIVVETGNQAKSVKKGDRVAFLSYHAYAEYDVATEDTLVKLPEQLAGQPFPAEPLGCAINIFERSDIREKDTVAIIGIGFLGALLCQLAKNKGAKVIAVSRRPYSLKFAKKYGADEVIPMTGTWEVSQKLAERTDGHFCSRVIEATGKQEAIDIATEIIAERGKMIIAGYHQDGMRQVNFQKWNWKGIDVINAHEREAAVYLKGMQQAVDAVAKGILHPELLYTHTFSLEDVNKGFEMTAQRPDGFMKAIVQIQN